MYVGRECMQKYVEVRGQLEVCSLLPYCELLKSVPSYSFGIGSLDFQKFAVIDYLLPQIEMIDVSFGNPH